MLETGLVSITFRGLTPPEIVEAAVKAGLGGIEWGGDVHVPPGEARTASLVRGLTEDAGLKVFAYGSYYRAGRGGKAAFEKVLGSALLLGAPVIRIWASDQGSAKLGEAEWAQLVKDTRQIADMAAARGIALSFECHPNTATDDYPAALRLLRAVGRENVSMYWQPNQHRSEAYNLKAAAALAPFATNIHTFHWDAASRRYPLAQGGRIWPRYIDCFRGTGRDHAFLLEFMHDDSPDSLPDAADTLRGWLGNR